MNETQVFWTLSIILNVLFASFVGETEIELYDGSFKIQINRFGLFCIIILVMFFASWFSYEAIIIKIIQKP